MVFTFFIISSSNLELTLVGLSCQGEILGTEAWQSGLMRRSEESEDLSKVSRVRIPSPPQTAAVNDLRYSVAFATIKLPWIGLRILHSALSQRIGNSAKTLRN